MTPGRFERTFLVKEIREAITSKIHLNTSIAVQFTSDEEILGK